MHSTPTSLGTGSNVQPGIYFRRKPPCSIERDRNRIVSWASKLEQGVPPEVNNIGQAESSMPYVNENINIGSLCSTADDICMKYEKADISADSLQEAMCDPILINDTKSSASKNYFDSCNFTPTTQDETIYADTNKQLSISHVLISQNIS